MKKSVLLLLGSTMTVMAWGQAARLVLNNSGATDPYFVWNPDPDAADNAGAYLVIDNPATNAITYTGTNTTGNFRTEAAQNKIRWNVGSTTGLYTINWGNQASVGFPLNVTVSSATGPGSFVFSTYSYYPYTQAALVGAPLAAGTFWNNVSYMAAANVTHMNDYATGSVNNSDQAIDRFWMIDTKEAGWAYGTSPTAVLSFDYANADIQGGNIITAATDLSAQRFNSTLNMWGDVLFVGSNWTGGAPTGNVNNVAVAGANFFKTWTLSNRLEPLPVELTSFKGTCKADRVQLMWSTATESNNDYFTILKSTDLTNWTMIGVVDGAGNSTTQRDYNFVDEQSEGMAYYRLQQTDMNGTTRDHDMISASCDGTNGTEIVTTWDDGTNVNVLVSSTQEVVHDVRLLDLQGKTMNAKPQQTIEDGMTTISFPKDHLATGIYVFQLQNTTQVMQRRVMVY